MIILPRVWTKQESDLKIMEALYKYKFLRGKILAMISGKNNEKRGYERISAMLRQGLIANETLTKLCKAKNGVTFNKKVASIYFLTTRGIVVYKKEILGHDLDGNERGRKPDEEALEKAYRTSVLLEELFNLYPGFISPAEYKIEKDLPNFFPIDLIYGNTYLFYDKNTSSSARKKLFMNCQSIAERQDKFQNLILTANERSKSSLLTYWKDNYGYDERILTEKDYEGIRHVITVGQGFKNYLFQNHQYEELVAPQNGCKYLIDGNSAMFYDLVGLPQRTIRKLKHTSGQLWLGFSNPQEVKLFNRLYPDVLNLNPQILLLEEIKESEEKSSDIRDRWSKVIDNLG